MTEPAKKTRLAIVGASVRAAAQSALRAGFDVVSADLFADADLDGVCPITKIPGERYPDALEGWLAEQNVDAWMYTGALENCPQLVDRMAKIAPLWGVSGEPLRRCRDPIVYGPELFYGEVAHVPTVRASAKIGWPCSIGGFESLLAKTQGHANGAGVWKVTDRESLDRVVRAGGYLQPRVAPSTPYSAVYCVTHAGGRLLGFTRQLMGNGDQEFSYRGSIGPIEPNERQREQLDHLGRALADRLALRGLVNVDLVEFEEWLVLVEINPRWSASVEMIERSGGASAIAAHAGCFGSETTEPPSRVPGRCGGKWVLFAERDLEVRAQFAAWAAERGYADLPRGDSRIAKGSPVCTVYVGGSCEREVAKKLEQEIANATQRLQA